MSGSMLYPTTASVHPSMSASVIDRTADTALGARSRSEPSHRKLVSTACLLWRPAGLALGLLTSRQRHARPGLVVAGIGGGSGCQRRRKGLPAGPPTRSYCMRLLYVRSATLAKKRSPAGLNAIPVISPNTSICTTKHALYLGEALRCCCRAEWIPVLL